MPLKILDIIDKAYIENLIRTKIGEAKTVEYKQELYKDTNDGKEELLADISSFANASGGTIFFGIKEERDETGKKTSKPEIVTPITGDNNPGDIIGKYSQLIQHYISPRLLVDIKAIHGWGENGKDYVLCIQIPKSFRSPHMVHVKDTRQYFFSRNSYGKYPLDVDQIRMAFLTSDSQAERIKRFREDRISQIVADETPVLLSSPQRLILHLIPIPSFFNNEQIDLSDTSLVSRLFVPFRGSASACHHNIDGFVVYYGSSNKAFTYSQVYFNGAIEAACSLDQIIRSAKCSGIFIENIVKGAINKYIISYRELNIVPPVLISLSMLGCEGVHICANEEDMIPLEGIIYESRPVDRNIAIFPDVLLEAWDSIELTTLLKPIYDRIWKASGFPRSPSYDKDGKYTSSNAQLRQ